MMIDLKNEGLEVVAWEVSFPLGIGRKVYEQEQAWANHTYGSGIVYHVEPLCRHSEALAGYAVRDARIAELELSAKRIYSEMLEANNSFARMFQAGAIKLTEERDQLRAELAEWSPVMQNLGDENQQLRAKLDASKFCADVADDLRAELADAKETITRYEVTAENCDVLRVELANQLEVKAFWIGRTRALEVELAALKEKALVIPAWLIDEDQMASRLEQAGWFPIHDAQWSGCEMFRSEISSLLNAAPVAKQVVMPDDDELMQMAFEIGEPCDDATGYWFSMEDWEKFTIELRARLNAADHAEGGQDE